MVGMSDVRGMAGSSGGVSSAPVQHIRCDFGSQFIFKYFDFKWRTCNCQVGGQVSVGDITLEAVAIASTTNTREHLSILIDGFPTINW